jgi:hypothetical protein
VGVYKLEDRISLNGRAQPPFIKQEQALRNPGSLHSVLELDGKVTRTSEELQRVTNLHARVCFEEAELVSDMSW